MTREDDSATQSSARPHQRDVMTIDDVAAYLQLGRRSVYRLAQEGKLPGRKVLGRWRFHVRVIDEWLCRAPQVERSPACGGGPR